MPPMPLTRKVAVALSAIALAFTSTPAVVHAQQTPAISWEQCPPQVSNEAAQCGSITVPMHYSDIDAGNIDVGFIKIPAANSAAKKGTIFGNPGGPGGDAYSLFGSNQISWPDALYQEWDLVAVQPRGLVGSTPVDCNTPAPQYDVIGMLTQEGAFVRDSCEQATPGYTASLTTDNTANDWEQVRLALGTEKISILGISYGTYLGSVYATRYPQHTDRVVLDSAMSPALAWNGIMASQEQGYVDSLHGFFNWLAENNDTYGLGATPLAAYQAWSNRIVSETGTNPTVAPPPAQVGDIPPAFAWTGQSGADAITAINPTSVSLQGLASQILNPGANQALSPLLTITRIWIPQPQMWPLLARIIAGQEDMPDLNQGADDPYALESTYTAVNMQRLIMCNENSVPANYQDLPRSAWASLVTGDLFSQPSTHFSSGLACAGTTPVSGPQPLDGSQLEIKPLMLQGNQDPQTPYIHHGELASAMDAHVVTIEGPGHGQTTFGDHGEVEDIYLNYLRTGEVHTNQVQGFVPTP